MSQALATQPAASPWSIINAEMLEKLDVEKLERVFALQERINANESEKALAAALAAFQRTSPPIKKDRKSNNGMYASLDDIMLKIRESLADNGLSVSFDTSGEGGELKCTCYVLHDGGAKFSRTVTVPVDKQMRVNDTQKMGSAISYAKRYALIAALNLIVSDHDDDGNSGGSSNITEEQATEIYNLLDPLPPTVKDGFLKWLEVDSVDAIPAASYGIAKKELERKLKATQP